MLSGKIIKIQSLIRNSYQQIVSLSSSNFIDVHPQVNEALRTNKPIVALESTVITHGMHYPSNLDTAMEVENIVRSEGAIPATIAIIDGRIKVGLTENQFKRLATLGQDVAIKCSRRDLAYVVSKQLCGGTTVAGTMIIAKMVGIKIFSTGGIGGVHRGGDKTFDISADLVELGRTPIAVISAGVKSILDIPKTLEYLETQGVCTATYQNPEKYFPAFYSRGKNIKIPYNLNDAEDAAKMIHKSLELNLNSGILIAVPIPEENAISDDVINSAIETALIQAKEKNITGKSVTPYLLQAVSEITKGKSLQANIALLKNNAKIASQISVQLSKIYTSPNQSLLLPPKKNDHNEKINVNNKVQNKKETIKGGDKVNVPVVIGASILDVVMAVKDGELNDCTFFTRKEILRVHKRFRELRPDLIPRQMTQNQASGIKIPRESIEKLPELRENPFKTRICKAFSRDGQGNLSFEDFLDFLSVFSEQAPRDIKIYYAFKIYDFDQDGFIGQTDLKSVLTTMTKNELAPEEQQQIAEKVIEEADVDGDGQLSIMEFEHVIMRAPDFLTTFRIRI